MYDELTSKQMADYAEFIQSGLGYFVNPGNRYFPYAIVEREFMDSIELCNLCVRMAFPHQLLKTIIVRIFDNLARWNTLGGRGLPPVPITIPIVQKAIRIEIDMLPAILSESHPYISFDEKKYRTTF